MRHRVAGRVLNADTQHRLAIRRNMARNLFLHDRIVTTPAKAKAVRPFVEKLVTRARHALDAKKAGNNAVWLHEVRLLARDVTDREALRRLLAEVAPRANRPGGYTRIVHESRRRIGDRAPLAIFEFVDRPVAVVEEPEEGAAKAGKPGKPSKSKAAPAKAKAKSAKKAPAAAAE
jgi:large subunit ribosomal protein L17